MIVQLDDTREQFGPGTVVARCNDIQSFGVYVRANGIQRAVLWLDDAVEELEIGARVERGLLAIRRVTNQCAEPPTVEEPAR